MAEKQEEVSAEEMSVLDAVDHLSSMAELDVQVPEEEDVRAKLHSFKELAEKEKEETLSTVKSSFKTIHNYLKQVYQQDKEHLKDVEMQRGIQAVMVLAEEAAEKIGTCSSLFQHTFKEGKLTEIKEFQELKDFYFNKIIKRFQEALAKEEKWKETWEEGQQNLLDIERMALKDLETVKRDQSYELFYIRKEDGNPFFNRNLLRHIRLVHDFDELIRDAQGVDPLLSTGGLLDREVQRRALAIKEKVKDSLADFYLEAMKYKEVPVVKEMNKCVFSLFLAANPRNLQQNTIGKSCTLYFTDFKMYLREVLRFSTYRSLLSKPLKGLDKISRTLIELVHHLCYIFYLYFDSHTEALDFIYDILGREQRKKRERKKEGRELLPFLDEVLDDYDHINKTLKRYPNGPLFKTIDIFYQRGQKEGFDPIYQGNHPAALYKMVSKSFDASCLRLPSPTFHHHVNIAEVNEEFSGFCRYLKQEKTQGKHLLFNLQDRTFWQESARCQALEKLQEEEELEGSLIVVTIPKRTPFYEQISPYNEIDGAEVFIDLFKEELFSSKECGFFFPKGISLKEMKSFTNEILP
ncbi:MAG: hypothetical protein HYZ47_02485, partial [Simkania negevensis]|nr:hypothetical protein [Simkania negevensis]